MIEFQDVCKVFQTAAGTVTAVDHVSLTIQDGEIFGIIGFSGAGKSTLVRCINLLERPTSGAVLVNGQDLLRLSRRQLRERRKKIGMIFQHFSLLPSRTVFENVAYALKGGSLSKSELREKVRGLLELVEISDKETAYPSQLSGGQKQRVAIARALANAPDVLLCDEATSALDPQTTKQILALLKQLNKTLGITILVITHEMEVVKEICSRVAVMEKGKIVEEGETYSIFSSPKTPLTRNFIGTTSHLQKIHELIRLQSPTVAVKPGELIAKLSYTEKSVTEPVISVISQKFGITFNILFADVDIVQGTQIGGTVAILGGEREQLTKAVEYLIEQNVNVEVIEDARLTL